MSRSETSSRSPRLHVSDALSDNARMTLTREQAHYLQDVLRLGDGDAVLVFNGRDGEWRASIEAARKSATLHVHERVRAQQALPDLHYAFAPLKHARLDYMVQKAVEMGASVLLPVLTRRTQVTRVNTERMRANVVEAAEQCGILVIAEVAEPVTLERYLGERDAARLLVFCDEEAETASPLAALGTHKPASIDILIGPEGGFAPEERTLLLKQPNTLRLSLGPRILRADTAAIAALALVQATLGDWR